jgi:pyruvate dehydrogenase (quinone)
LLEPKPDRAWRRSLVEEVADWWHTVEKRAMTPAHPVNPQRVAWEMSNLLPPDAIVAADSGTSAPWYAGFFRLQKGQRGSVSGGLASMGAAVPYALGAKFAHPSRPVVALVGDGAMQMSNMAELITVQKYWRRWQDPRFIVCVLNNEDLNEVTWEQRAMQGNPRYEATQALPDVHYARFADMIGLRGIFVDTPDGVRGAWETALRADRPVVIEVKTDPEVPPLPPHLTLAQTKAFLSAFAKGDKRSAQAMRHGIRQALQTDRVSSR